MEADAAVFPRAGEGQGLFRLLLHLAGEVAAQGGHGVVVRAHRGHVVGHYEPYVVLNKPVRAEERHVLDGHLVFRNRAGLVHAEHVHAREGLDAAHVVHESFFLRQADDASGEGHARQQIEPLRYHAYQGGDRGHHAILHAAAQPGDLLYRHDDAQRDDGDADDLHQPRERAHHLALLRGTGGLGLERQAVGVAVRTDVREPRAALAGDDEAAAEQLRAGRFLYFVGLAGDESLVRGALAVYHHGVRENLAPGGENNHVVAHHLGRGYLPLAAVAHHGALRRGEEGELVERFFAAQLLHDADGYVRDDNAEEHDLLYSADGYDAGGEQEKEHVEIGENVRADYLADGFAGRLDGRVAPAGVHALLRLRRAQALSGPRLENRQLPAVGDFRFSFMFKQFHKRHFSTVRVKVTVNYLLIWRKQREKTEICVLRLA